MMPAPKSKVSLPQPKPKVDETGRPKGVTFGQRKPTMPAAQGEFPDDFPESWYVRALVPGALPIPEITTYKQTNGPMYLTRMAYNKMWLTGTGQSEAHAVYMAEQFYMNETAQGRKDSVRVIEGDESSG